MVTANFKKTVSNTETWRLRQLLGKLHTKDTAAEQRHIKAELRNRGAAIHKRPRRAGFFDFGF